MVLVGLGQGVPGLEEVPERELGGHGDMELRSWRRAGDRRQTRGACKSAAGEAGVAAVGGGAGRCCPIGDEAGEVGAELGRSGCSRSLGSGWPRRGG